MEKPFFVIQTSQWSSSAYFSFSCRCIGWYLRSICLAQEIEYVNPYFYHGVYIVEHRRFFDMENKEMRIISYEFKLGHSALEATRNMDVAFGKDSASDRIARRWFEKSDDTNLDNLSRSHQWLTSMLWKTWMKTWTSNCARHYTAFTIRLFTDTSRI